MGTMNGGMAGGDLASTSSSSLEGAMAGTATGVRYCFFCVVHENSHSS